MRYDALDISNGLRKNKRYCMMLESLFKCSETLEINLKMKAMLIIVLMWLLLLIVKNTNTNTTTRTSACTIIIIKADTNTTTGGAREACARAVGPRLRRGMPKQRKPNKHKSTKTWNNIQNY